MTMSGQPVVTQRERDRANRKHSLNRRLRSLGWATLSLGIAVAALGFIAARCVA